MNSQHAVSASKNNNTKGTAQSLSAHAQPLHGILCVGCLPAALYALCCYFWMHSRRADCSSNYFLPYSNVTVMYNSRFCKATCRKTKVPTLIIDGVTSDIQGGWKWGSMWPHIPVTSFYSLKRCDGYVRPHWPPFSNRLSLNDPLFIFHILLSPNDPHFQNALSLNDPLFWKYLSVKMGVMLSLNDTHFHQQMTTSWYVPNICFEGGIYVVAK